MDREDRDKPGNVHTCRFCPYGSKSTFVMCKHVRLHRTRSKTDTFACDSVTPEMFECEFCGFETNLKTDLTEHSRVVHEGKEDNAELENIFKCYRCKNCDFGTHSVLVLMKHDNHQCNSSKQDEIMRDEKELCLVDNCKLGQFKSAKDVKWHKCEQCCYQTANRSCIERHLEAKKHLKQVVNRFQSGYKSIRFIVRKHTNVEDIRWVRCGQCLYKTEFKQDLKRHIMRSHMNPEDIKWFQCEHCPYKAKFKRYIKPHVMRSHANPEDIKWYRCLHCTYKAKKRSSLNIHVNRLHMNPENIRWFPCAQCTYQAGRKDQLKLHMTRHLNPEEINWFQCGHCAYKTKHKRNVRRHTIRMHVKPEDIKWFNCDQCTYAAKVKAELEEHIYRRHLNPQDAKWFQCDQCSFKTKSKRYIRKHGLKHNAGNIDWFRCTLCACKSREKNKLKMHVMRNHFLG